MSVLQTGYPLQNLQYGLLVRQLHFQSNHDNALYYENAGGVPWTATYIQAKGDPIADLYEDIAAEEKARATYQWIINMSDDTDLNDSLRFLRQREIIHSQRFREAVEILKDEQGKKRIF